MSFNVNVSPCTGMCHLLLVCQSFCCEGLAITTRLAIMLITIKMAFSVIGPSARIELHFELRSLLIANSYRFYHFTSLYILHLSTFVVDSELEAKCASEY